MVKKLVNPVEHIFLQSDGGEVPVEVLAELVTIEGRQVLQGVFRDITERKRKEDELRQLNQAVKQSSEGIATADLEGICHFINSTWAKMHGYQVSELIGKPASMLDSPEGKKNFPNVWEEIQTKGSWHGELQRIRKDGSSFTALMTSSLIRDANGEAVGIVGTCKDITELKQAEEKLKQYADELSNANEKLKSLDKMKDEFLSNVSHELKTPITSIIGYTELVVDEKLGKINEKQKNALDAVVRNSGRLNRLINSLIYLTLVRADKVKYNFGQIRIDRIIDNTVWDISPLATKKGLTIEKRIPQSLPSINGDEDKITEVLINLIENAIKFTPSDGRITVEADAEVDNIHIRVSDTGIGIPPEHITNMFKEFYQIDSSTTRNYGGTGLGLFISKTIVEAHNGKIWAESEGGAGTTVHVTLPK